MSLSKLNFKKLKKENFLIIPVISSYFETELSGLVILNEKGEFSNVSLLNYPSINIYSEKNGNYYEKIDFYLIPKHSKLVFFSFINRKLSFSFNSESYCFYPSFEEKFLNCIGLDFSKNVYSQSCENKDFVFSEDDFNTLINLVGEEKLLSLLNKKGNL